MGFDIQFKETEFSEPVTAGYYEFKAMIERGELGPKALARDPVLTGNDWWPLDELNVFHNHSPSRHSPGLRLQKKRDEAKYWEERTKHSWAQLASYSEGDLIENSFQLVPLPELLKRRNALGATRLYVLRSFEPERVFTFVFENDGIRIDVCQGRTSLWYSLPQVSSTDGVMQESSGKPFEPDETYRASRKLLYEHAPRLFQSWATLAEASELAPSCSTLTADGTGFRHHFLIPKKGVAVADWDNPHESEHAAQIELIKAYHQCIVAAKLGRFWQGQSPEPVDSGG